MKHFTFESSGLSYHGANPLMAETPMLPSDQASQKNRGMERPRIAAILLMQLAALLALSGAAIFYINWSSGVAQAEFMRALEPSTTMHSPQSPAPVQSVKTRGTCSRKA